MWMNQIFERFVESSPLTVMTRVLLEKALAPEALDQLFEQTAQVQYTRELLFSQLVELMSLVTCGIQPSVNAAYRNYSEKLNVSRTALYNKLNRSEPIITQALVRYTTEQFQPIISALSGQEQELLPGYRVRILDGNCLGASEHRLAVLREVPSAPLPGKSLVVLDPVTRLARDLFPCEDSYTSERALLESVLATMSAKDLWIADRHMCTLGFLLAIAQRQAYFIIRQHQTMPWSALEELRPLGRVETGRVFEQTVRIEDVDNQPLVMRRVVVHLEQPTREGDTEIAIFTNLPSHVDGRTVARLYRDRWRVEHLFQVVTQIFRCELKTLGYPKAALFGFSMALVIYNLFAVLKASLAAVHGVGKIEAGLSDFYVAKEVERNYGGMMIALPPSEWTIFSPMSSGQIALILLQLAEQVNLKKLVSSPRGPKKPKPKRTWDKKRPHVSTARLLAQERLNRQPC
jgi:hypothetical protein